MKASYASTDSLRIVRCAAMLTEYAPNRGDDYLLGKLFGLRLALVCLEWEPDTAAALIVNAEFCY